MTTQYDDAIAWIHSRLRLGIKPGLERMTYLLTQLGHPEQKNRWVHVAGTNGKGSTVAYLRTTLQAAGYEVGTFTSPYIETFNERISVNGQPISDDELVALITKIRPIVEAMATSPYGEPTEFEVITAMFFDYFATMHSIDIGIVEVGLGGRLDSTNVIDPILSVITTIGMDHIGILGDTLAKIASEKAGIIKPNRPVVSGVTQVELQPLFRQWALEQTAPYYEVGESYTIEQTTDNCFTFKTANNLYRDVVVGLVGDHQLRNAAVAIQALLLLQPLYPRVTEAVMRAGIATTKWPGRFETVHHKPTIVLDGAHNNEGMATFVDTLAKMYPSQPKQVLFSALTDKPLDSMLVRLLTVSNTTVTLTTFDYPRAMTASQLQTKAAQFELPHVADWRQTLTAFIEQAAVDDTVIAVTGSLYFIAEVRAYLLALE